MTPALSIIIATINDHQHLKNTVSSIQATSPGKYVEIIVVDDCSSQPVEPIDDVTIIHNPKRAGCGPSRHIGALVAQSEWLLFCDSHMHFMPGWFDAAYKAATGSEWTVYCGATPAFDKDHPDPNHPRHTYHGAMLTLCGPDRNVPNFTQVLEGTWLSPNEWGKWGDEIPCVMGASYLVSRDWFFNLNALKHLKTWGGDEVSLSLRSWLFGGKVKILQDMKIAHRWLVKGERTTFDGVQGHVLWNKLFLLHTLIPEGMWDGMNRKINANYFGLDLQKAQQMLKDTWGLVMAERAYVQSRQVVPLERIVAKFGLPLHL